MSVTNFPDVPYQPSRAGSRAHPHGKLQQSCFRPRRPNQGSEVCVGGRVEIAIERKMAVATELCSRMRRHFVAVHRKLSKIFFLVEEYLLTRAPEDPILLSYIVEPIRHDWEKSLNSLGVYGFFPASRSWTRILKYSRGLMWLSLQLSTSENNIAAVFAPRSE